MCLKLTYSDNTLHIAENDITCYKILLDTVMFDEYSGDDNYLGCNINHFKNNGIHYVSPFRYSPYNIGVLYESHLDTPVKSIRYLEPTTQKLNAYETISRGLHTFSSFVDAKDTIEFLYAKHFMVIVKCRIPAGASYYKGIFETLWGDTESYASNQLIVDELITNA